MKTFVGVDYHKKFSVATIMNEGGDILKQGRFDNHPQAVADFLELYAGDDCAATLEAGLNWTVMHDWLEQYVGQVTLAHPLKVRAIAEAKVKTDTIDSATLAHLLRADLIPAAHVGSPDSRLLKNIVRQRLFLVRIQTMLKNRIHALLGRHPLLRATRQAESLFTSKGLAWLAALPLPRPDRRLLDNELTVFRQVREAVVRCERSLRSVTAADDRIQRLMTIPGIGRILAALIVCEIDDIGRFVKPEKLHAYAGLVPSTYSSGGRTYHGRIIKQGNAYLRWALIEAVYPAIKKDAGLRLFYERLAGRKGANSAKVATARRLLTIVYRVLKDNRTYCACCYKSDRDAASLDAA